MNRESWWNDGMASADPPGAASAHALCEAVRTAMIASATESRRHELRMLTRRLVVELRDDGCEPQTVLLQVKEMLQRAGLGMHVEESRLALWKAIIDWTISEYYRAD